jgi:hypothetical protein
MAHDPRVFKDEYHLHYPDKANDWFPRLMRLAGRLLAIKEAQASALIQSPRVMVSEENSEQSQSTVVVHETDRGPFFFVHYISVCGQTS